jgi:hypothetical protein
MSRNTTRKASGGGISNPPNLRRLTVRYRGDPTYLRNNTESVACDLGKPHCGLYGEFSGTFEMTRGFFADTHPLPDSYAFRDGTAHCHA